MLGIIICEDNKVQRERIESIVENLILIENMHAEVRFVDGDPVRVLEHVKEKQETNLYLLDVNLESTISGIDLAREIRKYDPRGFIVFITSHIEMSYLTFVYKVEAMDYIIKESKEVLTKRIKECMDNALERYGNKSGANNNKVFSVKIGDRIENIQYDDIMFFETSSTAHKVTMYCTNRIIEFYSSIKDLEEQLDKQFYKCHRACIVNKNNIKEIDKKNKEAIMKNGQKCFISVRQLQDLIKEQC